MRRSALDLSLGLGLGDPHGAGGAVRPAAPVAADPARSTSMKLWYAPESFSGAGTADGTAVASWTDASGNGKHAVQATAAKKPVWKTNIQNGLGAVLFDGADDILALTSTTFSSEWTHFLVARLTDKTTNAINYAFGQTGQGFTLGGSNGTYGFFGQVDGGSDYMMTASEPTAWVLYTFQREHLYLNGAEAGPYTSVGTVDRIDIDTLGGRPDVGNLGLIGYLGELISFDRQLASGERSGIEAGLMAKWGL